MQEIFGIASFRSRQQVMRFDAALRRAGVAVYSEEEALYFCAPDMIEY